MLALLAVTAAAEQGYYTWVDEMGRVHNSPLPSSAKPNSADTNIISPAKTIAPEPVVDPTDEHFLSEEEFEQQLKKDRAERPPFFTWIDEQGQLRSQLIPQVTIELDEGQLSELTDHALLTSYRYPNYQDVPCCQQFSTRFKTLLKNNKSELFSGPKWVKSFPLKQGAAPAWYFSVPSVSAEREPRLSIKLRGTEQPLALIALDKEFKLLHVLPTLYSKVYPETWRAVAYQESLISIADPAVAAFILYFPLPVPDTANLEVQWQP